MSFREKSAWIHFVLLLGFGIYFGGILTLEIATHTVMAIRSPQEAKAPIDERERLIALRATRPAFYVLLVGAFLSIGTLHLGANTWLLAHCVLLAIWIAELTRCGTQIYYFRCGS